MGLVKYYGQGYSDTWTVMELYEIAEKAQMAYNCGNYRGNARIRARGFIDGVANLLHYATMFEKQYELA